MMLSSAGSRQNTLLSDSMLKLIIQQNLWPKKWVLEIQVFDIIYKLSEWLQKVADERTPRIKS
jgi:hypothetical protein